ncbi:VOC family protein [Orrella sp. JC864]|uniref:VOC family protein n=1 Tax=Orrella sp. JC864 TaxID=3120298 RepID=UPI00300B158C
MARPNMYLDHLVINVGYDMDAAAACFQALGFTLTPRGHHSLGSINHLMVFPDRYLELIGLPASGPVRQEIADSPLGIDGLVLRSNDAQASADALARAGFAPQGPQRLSRPVQLATGQEQAVFMTVRLPGQFAAGRVYYCQHLTPHLLWRQSWMRHDNGVGTLTGLVACSADPAAEAARYARLPQTPQPPDAAPFALHWLAHEQAPAGLGGLAARQPARPERYAAIMLSCADLDRMQALAREAGLATTRQGGRLTVALPRYDTLLVFHS